MKPRLLDLFCGAGGAAMGYRWAGFDVVGVDLYPQPDYPFAFEQRDAVAVVEELLLEGTLALGDFDAIHASPPCQAFTAMGTMWNARGNHPELVAVMRQALSLTRLPYVIENVPGAPMNGGHVTLCGSSFGLGAGGYELRRHRHFEASFPLLVPGCQHTKPTLGIYGDHARDRRRVQGEHHDRGRQFPAEVGKALAREAMEMPWATGWRGISQAIPPAYTAYIGGYLMLEVEARRTASAA